MRRRARWDPDEPIMQEITLELLADTADALGKYVRYKLVKFTQALYVYRVVAIDNDLDGGIGYKLIPDPHGDYGYVENFMPHMAAFDDVLFVDESFARVKYTVVQHDASRTIDILDSNGVLIARVKPDEDFQRGFVPPWAATEEG